MCANKRYWHCTSRNRTLAGVSVQAPAVSLRKYFCDRLLVGFGLDDFAATVVAGWANVVTQMRFACGRLDSKCRASQEIMRAMHTAFGW